MTTPASPTSAARRPCSRWAAAQPRPPRRQPRQRRPGPAPGGWRRPHHHRHRRRPAGRQGPRALPDHRAGPLQHDRPRGHRAVPVGPPPDRHPRPLRRLDPLPPRPTRPSSVSSRGRQPTEPYRRGEADLGRRSQRLGGPSEVGCARRPDERLRFCTQASVPNNARIIRTAPATNGRQRHASETSKATPKAPATRLSRFQSVRPVRIPLAIPEPWPLGTEALALAMEVSVPEAKRLRHTAVMRLSSLLLVASVPLSTSSRSPLPRPPWSAT